MAKTLFQRFKSFTLLTRKVGAICGADIIDPNYKMSPITWTVIISINAFFCCTFYTIYIGLVIEGDWKVMLQSLSLAGTAIQGYSKLILYIYHRLIVLSVDNKLNNIYFKYQKDKDCVEILRYRLDLTAKMLKIVTVIYIFTALTIVTYPLVYGWLHNQKMFVMQFWIPGIDHTTDRGYLIHNIVHSILIFMGGFGNFAGDMYIFVLIIHVPLWKDILKVKCKQLSKKAVEVRDSKRTMPLVKEIVEWHQNYNIFIQQIEEIYYGVIFVEIFTSVMNICCTLFSIVIRSWPAAFSYLALSTFVLYAYCGLGHIVELSNDEIIDVIFGDCLWYELSVAEQKIILLMLRKAQRPTTLTIGQIMPLSMSTALQLTKAIYSYMMMLLNFLEMDDM